MSKKVSGGVKTHQPFTTYDQQYKKIMNRFVISSVFILFFVSCVNDPAKVNSFSKNAKVPLQTINDVDLLYTDSAKLKLHVTAPVMEEFGGVNPYEEMAKGVKVEFFDSEEKVSSYLTSNYAINKKREQIMEAKNNVVVVNVKGEMLKTEHLIWDGKKRRIHTDAFVTITTKDQVLTGTGLDADEQFENYEIKNPVGTILLKDLD